LTLMNRDPANTGSPQEPFSYSEFGAVLRHAREVVWRESTEAFAARVGCTADEVELLEAGFPGVDAMVLMRAVAELGADMSMLTALKQRVAMLEVASHPVNFPDQP